MGAGFAKTGGRQICKVGQCCDVRLSRGWRFGYGVVVVAVVEADGEAPFVGMIDGLASMMTVRVLVAVLPQVSVAT